MWITYRPEGQAACEWWFRFEKCSDTEAEMIERRAGLDWDEVAERFRKGNRAARRAVLWTLLRREHHTLKYEDVHFTSEELTVDMDAQEISVWVEAAEKQRQEQGLTADQESALAVLKAAAVTARPAPGKDPAAPSGD